MPRSAPPTRSLPPARSKRRVRAGGPEGGIEPGDAHSARSLEDARSAALTLASRRDYTARELSDKLHDRGFDADVIAAALDDLRARGVVDDARVAAAHVRTAAAVKGRGRVRIRRELIARGVAGDVIDAAMSGVAKDDELASIRKILERKRWRPGAPLKERQKIFRHLLGRGFPADLISKALGRDRDFEGES